MVESKCRHSSQLSDHETDSPVDIDSSSILTLNHMDHDKKSDPPPTYEVASSIGNDGRVNLDLNSKFARYLQAFIPALEDFEKPLPDYEYLTLPNQPPPVPGLNIAIQIVGSRGDVQPFAAPSNELQRYGHRVRLATHDIFRDFVTKSGLESYFVGGDPNELMAYMIKTPGLIPSMETLAAGEISKKRRVAHEMLQGCWKSCIYPDPDSAEQSPFVADAIIANPPSFAHIHCAQALGISIHIMFTTPWTATKEFPHPLANIKRPKKYASVGKHISYTMVES